MPVPAGNSYSVASGKTIYAGRTGLDALGTVTILSEPAGEVPYLTAGQTMVLSLHESGGSTPLTGRQYRTEGTGRLVYEDQTEIQFSTARATNNMITLLRPTDKYGTYPNATIRQLMWLGAKNTPDGVVRLMSYRRVETIMRWARVNIPNCIMSKTCGIGGSMGAWGIIIFGLRHPEWFAAIYPDRPRWRYENTVGKIQVSNWTAFLETVTVAAAPGLSTDDGGGSVATFMDCIAYVSNAANKLPWVGWNVGRADGFAPFSDHIAAVAAMRAAKRGFAFAWNDGNHTGGKIPSQILASYPYGTFEIGKGYPLFTDHSLDQNPEIDLVGGINLNLSFRNVVESAGAWSCEVTSIANACTVKVEPISDVFTATVAKQIVTIPAANTWVAVSFSA